MSQVGRVEEHPECAGMWPGDSATFSSNYPGRSHVQVASICVAFMFCFSKTLKLLVMGTWRALHHPLFCEREAPER